MHITRVQATAESRRRVEPLRDALQTLDTQGTCRVTVETSAGTTGTGEVFFGRLEAAPAILAHLINDELAPAIVGDDPFLIRGIRDKLWHLTDYHGTVGLALFGIAGIDIALWDLLGRTLGQPVWRLLGAQRDRVPAYAMVGWLNYDLDRLKQVCTEAMEQGFRGVKLKVGALALEEDVARIEAVRSVLDRDRLIMVDANQVFSYAEALRRGRVYEELGCYWFEEPLRADDTGGLTECLEIGMLADAFNVPYASHGGGVHLHLLAALPNTLFMESGLLPADSPVKLVDGCYPLPDVPGFGGKQ